MKKFFLITVTAIVALVACHKMENVEEWPDMEVTFQANNFVRQTKADSPVSVWNDFQNFKCKAFLHAEGVDLESDGTVNGTSFQFFFGQNGETIYAYNSGNTVETTSANAVTHWAPTHTYYWPKGSKSFVNFIGWYGTTGSAASDPTIAYAYENGSYKATMTWNYSNATIGANGANLLYADMAWRFKQNTNPGSYSVSGASEGVPMLFHHALAQINVKAYAEGTQALPLSKGTGTDEGKIMDANAKWDITLKNVKITPVYTAGTLTLTNVDPGTNETQEWSAAAGTTGGWSGTGSAGDLALANDYKLVEVSKPGLNTTTGDVIAATCVLPQALAANSVALTFDMDIVTTYLADGKSNHEIIAVSIPLNSFGTSAWELNHKYTYYVKFVPSQSSVLFDPALDQIWSEQESAPQEL